MADVITAPGPVARPVDAALPPISTEERVSVASQWQLMWWRFRKHRLALIGAVIVSFFYLVVIAADFLAYADPDASDAQRGLIAPQGIQFFDEGQFRPHVNPLVGQRDPLTFKRVYAVDPTQKLPLSFLAEGFDYKFLGLIPTNRHLLGVEGANTAGPAVGYEPRNSDDG